jgi:hypothetical protein
MGRHLDHRRVSNERIELWAVGEPPPRAVIVSDIALATAAHAGKRHGDFEIRRVGKIREGWRPDEWFRRVPCAL